MNPNEHQEHTKDAELPISTKEKSNLTREQLNELFKVYFEINKKHNYQPQTPGSDGAEEIHAALQAKMDEFKSQN